MFSTHPRTRRHIYQSISGNRLRDFMEQCFRKHLFKCSYETLRFEFVNYFETRDPRTVESYIGRPAMIKRYASSNIVRINRQSGNLAKFDYMNERHIEAKKGLAQDLGLITFEGNLCILHHEKMSYYTEQATLESGNPSSENEGKGESKDDLCVCPVLEEDSHKGKGSEGKPICEGVPFSPDRFVEGGMGGERREREIIDCAHTKSVSQKITLIGFQFCNEVDDNDDNVCFE